MKLTLQSKKQEADGVFTLYFTASIPAIWVAGQSIKLELPIANYDTDERRFTISTAPHEKIIAITTRLTSSLFKRSLFALQLGGTVEASAIEGDFIWEESEKPHLFIAGGIGITPFFAMLKDREYKQLSLKAKLLYISPELTLPFMQQLDRWHQRYPEFNLTHIDKKTQFNDVKNTSSGYIYISGPARMVLDVQDQLLDEGIPPHLVKTDQFTGYKQF
ncbi:MAG TPA: FAD-dependent oxidoreductase [Candidatus Saccharimonadales bacterium]